MTVAADPIVSKLIAAIGPEKVRTDEVELGLFHGDASTFEMGAAGVVCVPTSRDDVAAIVRVCADQGRAFVARGGGTGLAGGAVPCGDRPVVIALSRLDRVIEVDTQGRFAWVEPGVINLDLTRHLEPFGFHFAPDPSSQQASTIGGNVANNAGDPIASPTASPTLTSWRSNSCFRRARPS
ncbi:MAG: FAD-binding oxidoreductase [Acidimicrobiales bacterium]